MASTVYISIDYGDLEIVLDELRKNAESYSTSGVAYEENTCELDRIIADIERQFGRPPAVEGPKTIPAPTPELDATRVGAASRNRRPAGG